MADHEQRGKFAIPSRMWLLEEENGLAKFKEIEVVWYWAMMEGEVEEHEDCKGPDNCSCWYSPDEKGQT